MEWPAALTRLVRRYCEALVRGDPCTASYYWRGAALLARLYGLSLPPVLGVDGDRYAESNG